MHQAIKTGLASAGVAYGVAGNAASIHYFKRPHILATGVGVGSAYALYRMHGRGSPKPMSQSQNRGRAVSKPAPTHIRGVRPR